ADTICICTIITLTQRQRSYGRSLMLLMLTSENSRPCSSGTIPVSGVTTRNGGDVLGRSDRFRLPSSRRCHANETRGPAGRSDLSRLSRTLGFPAIGFVASDSNDRSQLPNGFGR